MLGALGVVYCDIGTSPLYTLLTALEWAGGATPGGAIGMLSLIVWTLLITTSLKYVAVVLCQEDARASCCMRDEGRPFGAAL
jgi:KUP system potassium uptake protein